MAFNWLNETSRNFLESGYLLEGEEPLTRIREICDLAEERLGVKGFSDKMYDYMGRGWISLSSPIWSNYGRKARGFPVSCFGGMAAADSTADIMYFQAETAMLTKAGGGTSGTFHNIRPRGAKIKDNGTTSGPVHFMQLFDKATNVISQGGVRKGRMAPYMPLDSPDIMEFLDIMTEGNSIQGMTTGVTVTDEWMQQMIDGDREKRKVWGKVLKRRREIGVPYVMFKTTINENKPQVYKDKEMEIHASNLCSKLKGLASQV